MAKQRSLAERLKNIEKGIISYKTTQYSTGDSYNFYKVAVDIQPIYISDTTQAWQRDYKITITPDNPYDELVVYYYPDAASSVFRISYMERSFENQQIIYYMMPALQQSKQQYIDSYLPKHIVIYANCPFSTTTTYTDTRIR